ncbi:MAG TPA: formamidopyrimidine-DNA glycosylase, partial [Syntrophobacteraceae bacterium]|nr:formamidopyrimidine-DNA glycosylase [Syntrophobacteraceae bacterium]
MPELPEVETIRRYLEPAAGCRIRDVQRPRSRLQSISISPPLGQFRRRAVGRTIVAVRRAGKRVVLELDRPHADCIVMEPRMTGLVL